MDKHRCDPSRKRQPRMERGRTDDAIDRNGQSQRRDLSYEDTIPGHIDVATGVQRDKSAILGESRPESATTVRFDGGHKARFGLAIALSHRKVRSFLVAVAKRIDEP